MNAYIVEYNTSWEYGILFHIVVAHNEDEARAISENFERGRYYSIESITKIDLTATSVKEITYIE